MSSDNTDILALLGDLLRATDRQTEENTRKIDELRAEMRQTAQETNERFEQMFNRFGDAIAEGFVRMEKKVTGVQQGLVELRQEVVGVKQEVAGVRQEVAELRTDVQHIDQRLERMETNPATNPEVIRRLEVLEAIVLKKAS